MNTVPSSLRDYRSTAAERVPRTTAEAGLPKVGVEGLVTKEPAVCAQQFYTKVCVWLKRGSTEVLVTNWQWSVNKDLWWFLRPLLLVVLGSKAAPSYELKILCDATHKRKAGYCFQ